jgi:lipopolysaccharide transport system ATP-binding protein
MMMSDLAISATHIGKVYQIGALRAEFDSLTETLAHSFGQTVRRLRRSRPFGSGKEAFWALRDISFELRHGEVLGIIGHNGAGKSTLLKILSRITHPSEGRAEIYGRVGSLLEVGTGFHPELTGRENIYLNGTILGMKRSEISQRFDQIVDFAGVEQFIETPVKRYSSGMYLRLAFSVAAFLEPEILIVDEVLAVGDADFQKKCLGRMQEVSQQGHTVLFVSHNMSAILRLCSRGILLQHGQVVKTGSPREIVDHYLNSGNAAHGEKIWPASEVQALQLRPLALRVKQEGRTSDTISSTSPFEIEFEYEITEAMRYLLLQLTINTSEGISLLASQDRDNLDLEDQSTELRQPGRYVARCHFPANLFNNGTFSVSLGVTSRPKVQVYFTGEHLLTFNVDTTGGVGSHLTTRPPGFIRPLLPWQINQLGL